MFAIAKYRNELRLMQNCVLNCWYNINISLIRFFKFVQTYVRKHVKASQEFHQLPPRVIKFVSLSNTVIHRYGGQGTETYERRYIYNWQISQQICKLWLQHFFTQKHMPLNRKTIKLKFSTTEIFVKRKFSVLVKTAPIWKIFNTCLFVEWP